LCASVGNAMTASAGTAAAPRALCSPRVHAGVADCWKHTAALPRKSGGWGMRRPHAAPGLARECAGLGAQRVHPHGLLEALELVLAEVLEGEALADAQVGDGAGDQALRRVCTGAQARGQL